MCHLQNGNFPDFGNDIQFMDSFLKAIPKINKPLIVDRMMTLAIEYFGCSKTYLADLDDEYVNTVTEHLVDLSALIDHQFIKILQM